MHSEWPEHVCATNPDTCYCKGTQLIDAPLWDAHLLGFVVERASVLVFRCICKFNAHGKKSI
eukprot:4960406-Pleurochrysis_carterae.AAC.1